MLPVQSITHNINASFKTGIYFYFNMTRDSDSTPYLNAKKWHNFQKLQPFLKITTGRMTTLYSTIKLTHCVPLSCHFTSLTLFRNRMKIVFLKENECQLPPKQLWHTRSLFINIEKYTSNFKFQFSALQKCFYFKGFERAPHSMAGTPPRSIIIGAYRHATPRHIMPKPEMPGTYAWGPPCISHLSGAEKSLADLIKPKRCLWSFQECSKLHCTNSKYARKLSITKLILD